MSINVLYWDYEMYRCLLQEDTQLERMGAGVAVPFADGTRNHLVQRTREIQPDRCSSNSNWGIKPLIWKFRASFKIRNFKTAIVEH